jgi:hypothetical protein
VKLQISIAALFALLVCQTPCQREEHATTKPADALTEAQVWALDATYTDPLHGVTFHYPSLWKATTKFDYHPPALTRSESTAPIAGFGYSVGGFPRKANTGPYSRTNLEGVDFVYSAVAVATDSDCEATAASLSDSPKRSSVMVGGRTFSVYETGDAGMSQSIAGRLYVTYVDRTCYLFETDVATVSSGVVDGIKPLDPSQMKSIVSNLTDLMNSVRIAPKSTQTKQRSSESHPNLLPHSFFRSHCNKTPHSAPNHKRSWKVRDHSDVQSTLMAL